MKRKILVLTVVMVAAIALLGVGVAQASITSTKHNLSPSGPGTIKASGSQQNSEICIWCHTPHSANITAGNGGPLWNKGNNATSYTMYGTTLALTTPDATPNGSSKACLSCHDGVSAINSMVNTSGPGGVFSAATPTLVEFGATPAGTARLMTGPTNMGTSLANDHPVSIVYTATTKASLRVTSTTFGTSGTIASLLRSSKVECSSCHDAHVASGDSTAQGSIAGPLFLRLANTNSALCLTCHGK